MGVIWLFCWVGAVPSCLFLVVVGFGCFEYCDGLALWLGLSWLVAGFVGFV